MTADLLAAAPGAPAEAAFSWLCTYLIHSTVLLALVWACTAWLGRRVESVAETLWRVALFGAALTECNTISDLRLQFQHPA